MAEVRWTKATVDVLVDSRTEESGPVETWIPAYPHDDGTITLNLPVGQYRLVARSLGRGTVELPATVSSGKVTEQTVFLGPASRVHFSIRDHGEPNRYLPCKVQFLGMDGTPDPNLGVQIRAHGCDHQYHSEKGRFSVDVPPGKYRVIVTHGIEYSHHSTTIDLPPGRSVFVDATLERVVDTTGWISTDYHNHSTPSGDNYCGTDDRIINLAAEQVEFAPATEHNRIYDWWPHIRRLGLERELSTTVGLELTGPGTHLNAFPTHTGTVLSGQRCARVGKRPPNQCDRAARFRRGPSRSLGSLEPPERGPGYSAIATQTARRMAAIQGWFI